MALRGKTLGKFTKEELLIIHLSEYDEDKIDYFAPEAITLDGISKKSNNH